MLVLLTRPDLTIEDVAVQVGESYRNVSAAINFYRAFKKQTGQSPGRQQNGSLPLPSREGRRKGLIQKFNQIAIPVTVIPPLPSSIRSEGKNTHIPDSGSTNQ